MREAGFTQVMLKRDDIVGHPGRRGGRGRGGARERPARHRLPGAARLRGALGPPARLQGGHREGDAPDVPGRRFRCAAGLLLDFSRTRPGPRFDRRKTCKSWRCWRCPSASASPTRRCPGAGTSTNSRGLGDRRRGRPRQPRRRARLLPHPANGTASSCSRTSIRARCSWCSSPTSCGRRRARAEERIETARHSASFPAKACTATRSPRWCAGSTRWATAATTASRSSTTTTGSCRCRRCAERARRSVKWITGRVSRRSLPARRAAA